MSVNPPLSNKYMPDLHPTSHRNNYIKTVKWKDQMIYRHHSFLRPARRIASTLSGAGQITTISIFGSVGAGKTTLAESLAHVLHKYLSEDHKIEMDVIKVGKKELLDLDNFLTTVQRNCVIIFDDLTNVHKMVTNKRWSEIVSTFTEIRHRETGDYKMILIWMYHASRGFDLFIRSSDYTFITSAGGSEGDNVADIYNVPIDLMRMYKADRRRGREGGFFGPPNKDPKTKRKQPYFYKWDHPFRTCLFSDNEDTTQIIYPNRDWLTGKKCGICYKDKPANMDAVAQFMDDLKRKHKSNANTAARAYLIQHGISRFNYSTNSALNKIRKWVNDSHTTPKQIAAYLDGDHGNITPDAPDTPNGDNP